MFKTRLLSGIVLVIIAFATIFLGGDVLFATLLIISLIGVSELYKVVKIEKAPLGIVGYIGVVAYYFLIRAQKKEDLMMFAIILLILVMAVGMTSIGGPERMLQFMKSSVGGRKVSQVDSSDKNKVIEEEDEELAYEKIAEEFGIEPVKLMWRPNGMEFIKMELDTDIQVAELDYIRDREKMEFIISASYGEVSLGADNEDEITAHYYIKENIPIEVTEYKTPETETNRYKAEFKYNNLYYCLTGTMTKGEIENILKNLYFL